MIIKMSILCLFQSVFVTKTSQGFYQVVFLSSVSPVLLTEVLYYKYKLLQEHKYIQPTSKIMTGFVSMVLKVVWFFVCIFTECCNHFICNSSKRKEFLIAGLHC